jgi:hypothetical protein
VRQSVIDGMTHKRSADVRSLTATRSLEDWRGWMLHVSDDLGDELFVIPFAFVLGKPH